MAVAEELRQRTFVFACRIVVLCRELTQDVQTRDIARQLLRSGTSAAANYRAACRARSKREFVAKLGVVVEEADEVMFWLDLLDATGTRVDRALRVEAQELLAILAKSQSTARENLTRHE